MERVFRHFDINGDGKISASELRQCISAISGEEVTAAEAEAEVESYGGDGGLQFEDFVRFVDGGEERDRVKELREAFKMYEMEATGMITPQSLKKMLDKLGDSRSLDECKSMIAKFDLDGDGVLSFHEFQLMIL